MKKVVLVALFVASPAFADEAPTVTLTAQELQAIIAFEVARVQAAPVIQKVQSAFAPKPPEQKPEEKK